MLGILTAENISCETGFHIKLPTLRRWIAVLESRREGSEGGAVDGWLGVFGWFIIKKLQQLFAGLPFCKLRCGSSIAWIQMRRGTAHWKEATVVSAIVGTLRHSYRRAEEDPDVPSDMHCFGTYSNWIKDTLSLVMGLELFYFLSAFHLEVIQCQWFASCTECLGVFRMKQKK
jgi:hypothetical protein